MKRILFFLSLFLFPFISSGQQIDASFGAHVMKGEYKSVGGLAVKSIYKRWGLYGSCYFPTVKQLGDSILVHEPSYLGPQDSIVYDLNYMPYGFTAGVTYSFDFRLTAYAGVGLAIYRGKHIVYDNIYMPTSTGYYTTLYSSEYSERTFEQRRKICFEIGADYDVLPNPKWAMGPRIGYNTEFKLSGQVFFGYLFLEK